MSFFNLSTGAQTLAPSGTTPALTVNATGGGSLQLTNGSSNTFIADANGNVGIGITNPSEKLQVSGNTLSSGFFTSSGQLSVSTSDVTLISYLNGAGILTVYGSNFMHVVVIGGVTGITSYAKNTIFELNVSRTLTITMSGTSVLARLSAGPVTVYWKYTQFVAI